ncbi:Rpn family recombination-promoting nuclease/putative transposase [Lentibacillus salinarum]|uniref:Rpn family recombination-promoting nuclease/putative transposase n=1 Tax=Lentibacillus salinarum TaxID=446820 RepID=A0ABW3ZT07_9BACI
MPLATVVREQTKTSEYTKHDLLFKELIQTFFKEFIDIFFSDVHRHIDYHDMTFLSEEVHTDLHDGKTRRLDIIVETKLKGEGSVIIVHVEPQSYGQPDFHERMFHYYSLLYNKYRKPIVPIAVFSYDEKRYEQDAFTIEFPFFHVLTFNFLTLELRKKNWRDYIESDNPAAAALLSKMGYTNQERIEVKKEFLRMLVRMPLNPAKENMIYGFFESYLKLNEKEEAKLHEELGKMEDGEKVMELTISYEEKGKKEGRKEGRIEGEQAAKQEVAVEMLRKGVSIEFIAEVTHLEQVEIEKLRNRL